MIFIRLCKNLPQRRPHQKQQHHRLRSTLLFHMNVHWDELSFSRQGLSLLLQSCRGGTSIYFSLQNTFWQYASFTAESLKTHISDCYVCAHMPHRTLNSLITGWATNPHLDGNRRMNITDDGTADNEACASYDPSVTSHYHLNLTQPVRLSTVPFPLCFERKCLVEVGELAASLCKLTYHEINQNSVQIHCPFSSLPCSWTHPVEKGTNSLVDWICTGSVWRQHMVLYLWTGAADAPLKLSTTIVLVYIKKIKKIY